MVVRITLLAATLALLAIGIAAVYSVGHPAEASPAGQLDDYLANLWKKQLVFAAIGAVVFITLNLVNYRRFGAVSYWLYAFVLLLLGVLLFSKYITKLPFAPEINGTYRWIKISIKGYDLPRLQPSEICKLAYILALAWYLRYRNNPSRSPIVFPWR